MQSIGFVHTYKYNTVYPNAGWPSYELFLISIAYSCLLLKRSNREIELNCDERGAELLVGQLKLPYDRHTVLFKDVDEFCNEDIFLFPLFKIKSYAAQNRPFVH